MYIKTERRHNYGSIGDQPPEIVCLVTMQLDYTANWRESMGFIAHFLLISAFNFFCNSM